MFGLVLLGRRIPAQQLSAKVARVGMRFSAGNQLADEVRAEHDVGIEAQHPLSARRPDRLVLAGGKSNIRFVVDHAPARLDFVQQCPRAIAGGVVHDDHFEVAVVLLSGATQNSRPDTAPSSR